VIVTCLAGDSETRMARLVACSSLPDPVERMSPEHPPSDAPPILSAAAYDYVLGCTRGFAVSDRLSRRNLATMANSLSASIDQTRHGGVVSKNLEATRHMLDTDPILRELYALVEWMRQYGGRPGARLERVVLVRDDAEDGADRITKVS
jgi:hypothetical protein